MSKVSTVATLSAIRSVSPLKPARGVRLLAEDVCGRTLQKPMRKSITNRPG